MSASLTDRARTFAEAYVDTGGNTTEASKIAGYASEAGGRMALKSRQVQDYILKLQSELEVKDLPRRYSQLVAMADNKNLKPEVRFKVLALLVERASPLVRRHEHHHVHELAELSDTDLMTQIRRLQDELGLGPIEGGKLTAIADHSEAGESVPSPLGDSAETEAEIARQLSELGIAPDDSEGRE